MQYLQEKYSIYATPIQSKVINVVYYNCLDENGYTWGLMSRACYLRNYKIMDLLARYRFYDMLLVINGTNYRIEGLIFERDDLTGLRILYENGDGPRDDFFNDFGNPLTFLKWKSMYPNKKVTKYLDENLYPRRRSMGLDGGAFTEIEYPYQEKLGLLHRKERKIRNEYRVLNYKDRIRAKRDYLKWLQDIGKIERWLSYVRANDVAKEVFFKSLRSIAWS